MRPKPYDEYSPESIEKYAKKLTGKSLKGSPLFEKEAEMIKNKGQIGQLIEKLYFGYDLNCKQEADFLKAGVELKTCPLRRIGKKRKSSLLREQKGLSVKERLVLSIINFEKIHEETWKNNSLFNKVKLLLLMFYVHEKGMDKLDYAFELISLWKPSPRDMKIIEKDWNDIVEKIRTGKAHEISEGDTMYLGACTKGSTAKKSFRKQTFSDIPAKQRAFSFKRSYMDSVFEELLNKDLKTKSLLEGEDKSLDDRLQELFNPFIGKSGYEIEKELGLDYDSETPKSYLSILSNKIMGTNSEEEIEEFQKANITLKTIRLRPDDIPKESISFPTFRFKELAKQDWDDSDFRDVLEESKFFFVVFRIDIPLNKFERLSQEDKRKHVVLEKVKVWNMPENDIEEGARKVWEKTRDLIRDDKVEIIKRGNKLYNNLPSSKESKIAHVRPHAKNRDDTYELPDGRKMTKQCFWLNKEYIGEQLKD